MGFFRFEMNAHKSFFHLWVLISKRAGIPKEWQIPLAQGHPIGARAPCWQGNPKGTAFPWQGFPKAAALPWREASNGGQGPSWQEESNETRGFVAHDLACKV